MTSRKFIVLDTETAPTRKPINPNKPEPWNARVYDIGYVVADRSGKVYERNSFIVTDTFFDTRLMNSAFYADKLPQYRAGMNDTEWTPAPMVEVWQAINQDVKQYEVKDFWAFNCRFDKTALNATIKDYSNGFRPYFLPYGCEWRDIWDYAGSTICKTKKYVMWAVANGRMTLTGNPQTTVEAVYSYISGNKFSERHTALADAEIELAILLKCFKRHQKARMSIGQGWRDAAAIYAKQKADVA